MTPKNVLVFQVFDFTTVVNENKQLLKLIQSPSEFPRSFWKTSEATSLYLTMTWKIYLFWNSWASLMRHKSFEWSSLAIAKLCAGSEARRKMWNVKLLSNSFSWSIESEREKLISFMYKQWAKESPMSKCENGEKKIMKGNFWYLIMKAPRLVPLEIDYWLLDLPICYFCSFHGILGWYILKL